MSITVFFNLFFYISNVISKSKYFSDINLSRIQIGWKHYKEIDSSDDCLGFRYLTFWRRGGTYQSFFISLIASMKNRCATLLVVRKDHTPCRNFSPISSSISAVESHNDTNIILRFKLQGDNLSLVLISRKRI